MYYEQSVRFQEEDYKALKDFKEIEAGYYPDFDTWDYPKGHFDETCMDAVPLSLYIITLSSSLEDAVRLAISHGDDGDTCEKIHQSRVWPLWPWPLWPQYNTIRLTPYGASLIVLDFPVTFPQSCLSPLLSSRPWWGGRCGPGRANRTGQKMADLQLNKCYKGILFRPLGCFVGYLL